MSINSIKWNGSDDMELVYAFLMCVIGYVLIYQWGGNCAINKKRKFSFALVLAVFDFLVAGQCIACFMERIGK